ncbi:hypothetical protein CHS0354_022713 [Potamilus streckersoni]|uniref:TIR domain-containing protein n=1 Tax=Potamilus streckersoni TaxID=2493646 RepID=A0AAE0RT82_9BIVA|nr:hypothetical protein CHS0354_022713 [Potamilus streckersoni]
MATVINSLQRLNWTPTKHIIILLLFQVLVSSTLLSDTSPGLCPESCFCSKTLTSVNCQGKKLTSIPSGIPRSVEKLYLSYNDLTSIPALSFQNLTNLQLLYLDHNSISDIKPRGFENLSNVVYIDLRSNLLPYLVANSFSGMPKLESVYLTTNRLETIDRQAFHGSNNLRNISLSANKFSSIPSLGYQPKFKSLVMEGNSITNGTFPESFSGSSQFTDIILSNNKIKKLTKSSFATLRNTSVTKVEISRNAISDIAEDTFSVLTSLQSLKLAVNPLSGLVLEIALRGLNSKDFTYLNIENISLGGNLPNSAFHLLRNTSFKYLIMSNNVIRNIPDRAFADLENLLTLDLSGCGIMIIENTAFQGLKSLEILFMNDNFLSDVPHNLPSTLRKLYLNGNMIASLPDNIFANLTLLQELYLGDNLIHELMEDSFFGLADLSTLHLVANKIATLPKMVFNSLIRLQSLELNKNNLKHVQDTDDIFSPMVSLIYLNIADNYCNYIPLHSFNKLSSLQHLHLENNNLGPLIANDGTSSLLLGLQQLYDLYLNNNNITDLPDLLFRDLVSLKNLALRNNKISGWGSDLFKTTVHLTDVDLSMNLIAILRDQNLKDLSGLDSLNLNLTDNPFACTCDLRWFRDWIKTTKVKVINIDHYTCNSPKEWSGKPLLTFDQTKINCDFFTWYEILAAAVASVVVVTIVFLAFYRNRWRIWLRLYKIQKRFRRTRIVPRDGQVGYEAVPGEDRKYDAYISYTEEDYQWVIENILKGIDEGLDNNRQKCGGRFKLYMKHRDSIPGEFAISSMLETMDASRHVIIVLSQYYTEDRFHEMELEVILDKHAEREIDSFVVVMKGPLEAKHVPKCLRQTMKRGEFLEWEDDANTKEAFRTRLQERLDRKAHSED